MRSAEGALISVRGTMRHNRRVMAATWDEFERLELTVGRVTAVEDFPEARVPAYKLTIDLGPKGTRRSSAQITHYSADELLGRQVVCVLGFEPKRIAGFRSEVLVLGAMSDEHGVVLLRPDREVADGTPVA
jgi:tRNA-binding protein